VTFSIVARAADAQLLGMAIASSSPAVAARCAHARAGVGVVATQNITDPSLGPRLLEALGRGTRARTALDECLAATPYAAYRQLLVLARDGPPVVHSGAHALGIASSAIGQHAAAAGNLLAGTDIPEAMIAAFDATDGHLGARLLRALRAAADRAGRPLADRRSAGRLERR
jgi:uncharacterized Ntn-hydrolase superfamily protein